MKKLVLGFCFIFSLCVYAQESPDNNTSDEAAIGSHKSSLTANLRRLALEISSVDVRNSDQYQDSSITGLRANSQTIYKGVLDFVLEYDNPHIRWFNSAYLAYGRTEIRPTNRDRTVNVTEDIINPGSELSYKMAKLGTYHLGPFVFGEYETEFEKHNDQPRYHLLRAKTGAAIFKKNDSSGAYVGLVSEYDLTYNQYTSKYGWEAGAEWKFPLRDGVDFDLEGYYRNFFYHSDYVGSDLKYNLSASGRMNVRIIGQFRLSPYVTYRQVKSREATKAGSTLITGLALSCRGKFDFW